MEFSSWAISDMILWLPLNICTCIFGLQFMPTLINQPARPVQPAGTGNLKKKSSCENLVNQHRPEADPKKQFGYDHAQRSAGDKDFMNRPCPLTSRLGSFSWHCHLQEHASQRGFSPEDTESSLIILSLTNTEQQSEQ